jgi:uncharacterized membrane protein YraQ (UPF0718 family)
MEHDGPHCCPSGNNSKKAAHSHGARIDFVLWGSLGLIVPAYLFHLFGSHVVAPSVITGFSHAVFSVLNKMWWGVLFGIFFVGLLSDIPRDVVMSLLGKNQGLKGILRATLAGVFLDLCSHGILLVGMKLYERGASLGQLMAFLIASPWNSISLTFVLWSLIGLKWTLLILLLSLVIAIISGLIFELLVRRGVLPENPNRAARGKDYTIIQALKEGVRHISFRPRHLLKILKSGFSESLMILRWLFLGVVLAGIFQGVFDVATFKTLYGPSLTGLGITLLTATLIEVCSEGSTPIAADIFVRAHAPGNAFAFLMTGVSTDYTEIMVLKETTGSWKVAFFLPLVTLPQVVAISLILNM